MKKSYTNSICTLLVLCTFALLVSSCSKKSEPDPLDQYVGSWTQVLPNGQLNPSNGVTVSKSGNTLLLSDFLITSIKATVSGSGFQADNKNLATGQPYQHPDNSVSELYLQNLSGSVTGDKLTLRFTAFSQSRTMTFKYDDSLVFQKQ
ncbi:hypothetical protein GCM10028806_56410 [Spirosoma terrae]|uniref:DUF5004 domain-containing protein n=1 Tax=Spirosoma terrae TaxID=1968276 RepID=A0A6L9LCZ1_9BACT|nr:hypothetical protein [Spirosoma terrae]NDU96683.1 hypothetical protein [Spirosoma terrae]